MADFRLNPALLQTSKQATANISAPLAGISSATEQGIGIMDRMLQRSNERRKEKLAIEAKALEESNTLNRLNLKIQADKNLAEQKFGYDSIVAKNAREQENKLFDAKVKHELNLKNIAHKNKLAEQQVAFENNLDAIALTGSQQRQTEEYRQQFESGENKKNMQMQLAVAKAKLTKPDTFSKKESLKLAQKYGGVDKIIDTGLKELQKNQWFTSGIDEDSRRRLRAELTNRISTDEASMRRFITNPDNFARNIMLETGKVDSKFNPAGLNPFSSQSLFETTYLPNTK